MLIFPPKLLFTFSTLQLPPPKILTLIPSSQIVTRTLPRSFSGIRCSCFSSDEGVESELGRLLSLLPENMRGRVEKHPELHGLIEVVMDLGRKPLARFPSGDFDLAESPITVHDIEFATSQVGDFALDNRAGISRTLHRISAIRNRKGAIIGLTCRVGRAITGSADLLRDLVKDGASLLLIGPPGVGKTTIIREIARMLAVDYGKRVMIVDTSNEIGGDGDIPHAGIGSARRMQVPVSDMQHRVLIEAVENHMPQVIVIDEIGTKLEAMAATTISQRGIQLVATAHGITIDNLLKNPALDMLVGGIQSVTLGDEEASRRRVQKTILERKGPPTFLCAVELMSKTELRVHRSLEATVDSLLAGQCPEFDVRKLNFQGHEENTKEELLEPFSKGSNGHNGLETIPYMDIEKADRGVSLLKSPTIVETSYDDVRSIRLFVYGILEATVLQGVRKLNLEDEIELTDNVSDADVLLALQSKLKKNLGIQAAAKSHDKPIYVTKTSSLVQVMKALRSLTNDHEDISNGFELEDQPKSSEKIDALEEARIAIEQVVIGKGEAVELLARPSHIVRLQADLARRYQLQSEVVGVNPEARLHIFPIYFTTENQNDKDVVEGDTGLEEFLQSNGNGKNGSSLYVERLPILPD